MTIGELVKEAKKTKDEKLIDEIIAYYEPYFFNNIIKRYGNSYLDKAKNELPILVNYYLEKDIKSPLGMFLYAKSHFIFNDNSAYNERIKSNGKFIKDHYTDKLFNNLLAINNTAILSEKELYKLAVYDIDNLYNNYVKTKKKSNVTNYFNSLIRWLKKKYNDEEFLLLSYVRKIGVNDEIKAYFYSKYMFLLGKYTKVSLEDYKIIIDEFLNKIGTSNKTLKELPREKLLEKLEFYSKKTDIELKNNVENELINIKNGKNFNYEFLYEYYAYIKELVFKKFVDKVEVKEEILRDEIEKRYDKAFDDAINYVRKNRNFLLKKYINNRLSEGIKGKGSLFKKIPSIDENIKKEMDSNLYLIDYYAHKFEEVCPKEILQNELKAKYYIMAYDYYSKSLSISFTLYMQRKLLNMAKTITADYKSSGSSVRFVDKDKENKINDKLYLVSHYAVKYAGSCPREVLESKLKTKYYDIVNNYYKKSRKILLIDYLKTNLCAEAKEIVTNYSDDSLSMDSVKMLK